MPQITRFFHSCMFIFRIKVTMFLCFPPPRLFRLAQITRLLFQWVSLPMVMLQHMKMKTGFSGILPKLRMKVVCLYCFVFFCYCIYLSFRLKKCFVHAYGNVLYGFFHPHFYPSSLISYKICNCAPKYGIMLVTFKIIILLETGVLKVSNRR